MEPKFTKAPWIAISGTIKATLGTNKELRDFAEFTLRGDVPVVILQEPYAQFPSPQWIEMQEANLKLIACAPEMYEMLQSCAAFIEQIKDYGIANWSDETKLRELLEKATK